MGWTSLHREPGQSDRAFFESLMPVTLTENGHILAYASYNRRTFYAAVKGTNGNPDEVWCLVVLMRWTRGWFNFTYKEMDDAMGPAEDDCPARILDLLTPTEERWANEWRARCRANLARKAGAARLADGALVRFDEPWVFQGVPRRFLRFRRHGRHLVWEVLDDSGRFLFPGRLPGDWWGRNWRAAARCANCGALLRDTSGTDANVPWVHELSGNGFCDVSCPGDAVLLAGTADRPVAVPA